MKEKKKTLVIGLLMISALILMISGTYAFISLRLAGEKKQVIVSGTIAMELFEDENNLVVTDAYPMFDEVGMIQEPFTFRLVNKGTSTARYTLSLVEIGIGTLDESNVKYGFTKDGTAKIGLLSELENGVIDSGTIAGNNTTINYELRLWLKEDIEDETVAAGRSLNYKIHIEAGQIIEIEKEQLVLAGHNFPVEETTSTFPDFNNISSATNGRGIYKYKEDGVDIYYWRGNVAETEASDNNVIFAGYCWQMVRTTKTGGIKMIYNGEVVNPVTDENGNVIGGQCTNTGEATQLPELTIFNGFISNAGAGYMNGIPEATAETTNVCIKLNSTGTAAEIGTETSEESCTSARGKWAETPYEATHANVVNSDIKNTIDTWFASSNLNTQENLEKIEDAVYCNDRSISQGLGYAHEAAIYGADYRIGGNATSPSLECTNLNDRFTVNSENGNGALTYPVGLLTADEIVLAGAGYTANSDYYLYTGQDYWLLSPSDHDTWDIYSFIVTKNGKLYSDWSSYPNIGARPAISLASSNTFANGGTGTKDNPYVVE